MLSADISIKKNEKKKKEYNFFFFFPMGIISLTKKEIYNNFYINFFFRFYK
jgi:hypothetical protein